jgi:hypothetical protein
MHRLGLAVIAAAAVVALVPSLGVAGQPVNQQTLFSGTSDPYDHNLCGIDFTGVDRFVENYKQDASGAAIDNVNVATTYTAANGKSIEFHGAGMAKFTAPVDNGDRTVTFTLRIEGNAPQIKIPNGPVIGHTTGTATLLVTADAATGDFISFQFLRDTGQSGEGACDAIVAHLTDP